MGFNVPFAAAVSAARHLSEISEAYYIEQQQAGVEFVVTLDEFRKIIGLNIGYLENGETLAKFKKDLKENQIVLPKDLPETLFRTIIMGCYQHAHWDNFVKHQETRPYLMYDAINDSRIRKNHAQADGIIRVVSDRFWQTNYPPNGINCRCRLISLNERQAQERSNNAQGLNKFITSKMKPDEGWDFNVGEDLHAFMRVGIVGLVRKDAKYKAC